jgi:hypothetical protein
VNFSDDGELLRPALSDLLRTKEVCDRRGLRRLPSIGRGLDQFKRRIKRRFFPNAQVWGADSIRLIRGNVDASTFSPRGPVRLFSAQPAHCLPSTHMSEELSLAWVFEVLSRRVAMEASRPVFPKTLAHAECQTSEAKFLHGMIAAHVVVQFGTYKVSSSQARYAKLVRKSEFSSSR